MSHRLATVTLVLAMLASGSPSAAQYRRVNPSASEISFTYNQMGARVYGTFSQFEATLDFDSTNPTAARAGIIIELTSIDAGNSDANSELQKPGWFDTAVYPQARFESQSVTALGDNLYQVGGQLTLKGLTREVDVRIALKPENGIGVFDGTFVLKRGDFNIGDGEWADYGVVSNEINIRFRVVAPEQ